MLLQSIVVAVTVGCVEAHAYAWAGFDSDAFQEFGLETHHKPRRGQDLAERFPRRIFFERRLFNKYRV